MPFTYAIAFLRLGRPMRRAIWAKHSAWIVRRDQDGIPALRYCRRLPDGGLADRLYEATASDIFAEDWEEA